MLREVCGQSGLGERVQCCCDLSAWVQSAQALNSTLSPALLGDQQNSCDFSGNLWQTDHLRQCFTLRKLFELNNVVIGTGVRRTIADDLVIGSIYLRQCW